MTIVPFDAVRSVFIGLPLQLMQFLRTIIFIIASLKLFGSDIQQSWRTVSWNGFITLGQNDTPIVI